VEKYSRSEKATDDTAHAHCMCISRATNTRSEYVILIAFSLQEWLQERSSVLRYKNTVSPVRFLKHVVEVPFLLKYDAGLLGNFFFWTFRRNIFILEDEPTAKFRNVNNFNPE